MFSKHGWQVVKNIDDADLVQFTGGGDVDPSLYGEEDHPTLRKQHDGDDFEMDIYLKTMQKGKPMAGICRGGQLLHVLCGGRLVQHADNHSSNGHEAFSRHLQEDYSIMVSSTHHQMMADFDAGDVLLYTPQLAKIKQGFVDGDIYNHDNSHGIDIEAMLHPEYNTLSFQPLPEFELDYNNECTDTSFKFLKLLEY